MTDNNAKFSQWEISMLLLGIDQAHNHQARLWQRLQNALADPSEEEQALIGKVRSLTICQEATLIKRLEERIRAVVEELSESERACGGDIADPLSIPLDDDLIIFRPSSQKADY